MSTEQSKFLIVAYPQLAEKDFDKIENFRRQHDSQYNLIRPHFTLVFPVAGVDVKELIAGTRRQVNGTDRISFSIHEAVIHEDSFDDQHRLFLVPTEGYDQLVHLHDKLYSSHLREHLKSDLAYIPHITIGISQDKNRIQKLKDEWNNRKSMIQGTITTVDIIQYEKETLTTVEAIRLMR